MVTFWNEHQAHIQENPILVNTQQNASILFLNSFIQLCRCNQILRNRPQFFRYKVPILKINASSQSAMFTQGTTGFSRAPHSLRFCLYGLITSLRPMARLKKKKIKTSTLFNIQQANFLNEFGVLYYRSLKITVRVIH